MANKYHGNGDPGFNSGKKWTPPKRTFGTPGLTLKLPSWPGLPGKASDIDWGERTPKENLNYPQKKGL